MFKLPVVAALSGVTLVAAPTMGQPITPINLGTLGSTSSAPSWSIGMDINNSDVVVGHASNAASSLIGAFAWTSGGGMQALPTGGGGGSGLFRSDIAYAINNSGVIVGGGTWSSGPNTAAHRAFRYNGSTVTDLGTLSPLLDSTATGINTQGDIVGYSSNASNSFAFLHRNNVMSLVPLGEAHDINDNGLIVGHGGSTWTARTWDTVSGQLTNLGTLGGVRSRAFAVNNAGQVVGWSSTGAGEWHSYVWSAATGMVDLGAATAPRIESFAWDINNLGVIVGHTNNLGTHRAYVWQNGVTTDLNSLLPSNSGWVLERANAINDYNCITGWGRYRGEQRAFVMCIPAPSGAWCIVAALGGGAMRRRRRC